MRRDEKASLFRPFTQDIIKRGIKNDRVLCKNGDFSGYKKLLKDSSTKLSFACDFYLNKILPQWDYDNLI